MNSADEDERSSTESNDAVEAREKMTSSIEQNGQEIEEGRCDESARSASTGNISTPANAGESADETEVGKSDDDFCTRRLAMNRVSAKHRRDRKRHYLIRLEEKLQSLMESNKNLMSENGQLKKNITQVRVRYNMVAANQNPASSIGVAAAPHATGVAGHGLLQPARTRIGDAGAGAGAGAGVPVMRPSPGIPMMAPNGAPAAVTGSLSSMYGYPVQGPGGVTLIPAATSTTMLPQQAIYPPGAQQHHFGTNPLMVPTAVPAGYPAQYAIDPRLRTEPCLEMPRMMYQQGLNVGVSYLTAPAGSSVPIVPGGGGGTTWMNPAMMHQMDAIRMDPSQMNTTAPNVQTGSEKNLGDNGKKDEEIPTSSPQPPPGKGDASLGGTTEVSQQGDHVGLTEDEVDSPLPGEHEENAKVEDSPAPAALIQ
jgi:hypothetical protein